MTLPLVEQIEALLPQTQCTQCGFTGCQPYAQGISEGRADINQCPPGGSAGIAKLANLLALAEKPLNPKFGVEQARKVAFIVESDCIGCTKCIPPCPVDAILGANKQLHTVITNECTGCELCLAPCPVNCIIMKDLDKPTTWGQLDAENAKHRYQKKQQRETKQAQKKQAQIKKQKLLLRKSS